MLAGWVDPGDEDPDDDPSDDPSDVPSDVPSGQPIGSTGGLGELPTDTTGPAPDSEKPGAASSAAPKPADDPGPTMLSVGKQSAGDRMLTLPFLGGIALLALVARTAAALDGPDRTGAAVAASVTEEVTSVPASRGTPAAPAPRDAPAQQAGHARGQRSDGGRARPPADHGAGRGLRCLPLRRHPAGRGPGPGRALRAAQDEPGRGHRPGRRGDPASVRRWGSSRSRTSAWSRCSSRAAPPSRR